MQVKIQNKAGHKVIKINRRKAIREKCLNCSGWIPKEVSNCGFVDCPLHSFRSGKEKQNPAMRKKAIRRYCLKPIFGKILPLIHQSENNLWEIAARPYLSKIRTQFSV